jgi:anti-anti-sigma regulatory factor
VELRSVGRTIVLVLHGALRATSLPALDAQIDQLACIPFDEVIVEFGGLIALDATGARVLIALATTSRV